MPKGKSSSKKNPPKVIARQLSARAASQRNEDLNNSNVVKEVEKPVAEIQKSGTKAKKIYYDGEGNVITKGESKARAHAAFSKRAKAHRDAVSRMSTGERKGYYNSNATKGKARRKAVQGNLLFPVHRQKRSMTADIKQRISMEAAVFTSAVLEYMAAEVLELAGNAAKEYKKSRIIPRYIMLAIRQDDEINQLCPPSTTFATAGVCPKPVPKFLLKTNVSRGKATWNEGGYYQKLTTHKLWEGPTAATTAPKE